MSAAIEPRLLPPTAASIAAKTPPAVHSRPQIPALTGLRFFAAFFVLWGHSMGWLAQFRDSQINIYFSFFGVPGMSLFFVLSGFVIHYNYRDLFLRAGIARAASEFAAARFARLYPLYLVFLLLAIVADNFIPVIAAAPQALPILGYLVTLTQSWWYIVYDGRSIVTWLFPLSWSISTEMFFYAFYPAVVFSIASIVRPKQMIWIAACYVGIVLALLILSGAYLGPLLLMAQTYIPDYLAVDKGESSFYRWLFYFSPYTRVFEFLLGCMMAQAIMQLTSRPVSVHERRWAACALSVSLLSLLFISLLEVDVIKAPVFGGYVHHLESSFLCAPPIAVVLFYVARYQSWFTRFLSLPSLVLLGELSYSIYLVHFWTLRLFMHPARVLTPLWILDAGLCVVCGMALTVLVSYGTYHLIEIPSRVWLRRSLGGAISVAFGDSRATILIDPTFTPVATVKRLVFSASAAVALLVVIITGEAVRSHEVIGYFHNLVYHRSEVAVVSASYGLSCQGFAVRPPASNWASQGNVTDAIKRFCRFSAKCDVQVNVDWLGDPASGCGKDFTVAYKCSGQPELKTGYIPAEAHGKHIVLECGAMGASSAASSLSPFVNRGARAR